MMAAILLPGLTVGLVAWTGYERALDNAAAQRRQQVRALREHALRVFEAQSLAITLVDAELGDRKIGPDGGPPLIDIMQRVVEQSPHIEGIWLTDANGTIVNGAGSTPTESASLGGRPHFEILRQDSDFHIGIDSRPEGGWSLSILRRRNAANPEAAFSGAIKVAVRMSYFQHFWEDAAAQDGRIVSLIRADGELLARFPALSGPPIRLPPHSTFFAALKTHPNEGEYEFHSIIDLTDRLYSYARLPELDAFIIVGTDRDQVLADWRMETLVQVLIALFVSTILVAASFQALRRGRALAAANARLLSATGDLEAEIGRRRAVESTLMAREEHERALREGEERFRLLFENLTQGVVIHGSDGTILSANQAAEEILGCTQAEMILMQQDGADWGAIDEEGRRCPPDTHPAYRALATGEVVQDVLMGVYNPRRSERRWIVIDAVPMLRDGDTKPSGAYAVFSDVTDRRRGEQAQRLLIREVDHRAKNALAVVQAVIRLSKADTPERFVEVVEGRVAALAHAHTILAMNRWEGASLTKLAQVELEAYAEPGTDRIILAGPDIFVRPEAAQPLSMVLHELATNAAKHGALSHPDGRLSVRWQVIEDGEWIRLEWQEQATIPAMEPQRRGFGSTMIEASMRQQLQGTISYEWRAEGLLAIIRFPADRLVPPAEEGAADASPA